MWKNADVSRLAYIGFLMDLSNGWQVGSSVYYRYRSPSHARHEGSMPMAIGIDPSWLAPDSLRSPLFALLMPFRLLFIIKNT